MHIHPTTLQLSKRLNLFLPIPGIVALAAFLMTLSPGVYPGYPSALTAAAAGLIPPLGVDHPVFAWVVRFIVSHSTVPLPAALNLFSAVCGTLCAVLLYHLVANLILFFSCETGSGSRQVAGAASRSASELPQDMLLYNRRMVPFAVAGGLAAALLLTFMVPLWAASTRAHPAPFDLLLALAAFDLLFMCESVSRTFARILILALSCFLFAMGIFEASVFLLLLPCYAFFSYSTFYYSSRKTPIMIALPLGWAAGIVCAVSALCQNGLASSPAGINSFTLAGAYMLASHHYHEIRSFFPQTGWLLLLFQTALPSLILLFGASSFFGEKPRGRLPALIILTLTSIPSLLNLSFSPIALFLRAEHLAVFGCAITAAATAMVFAACLKMTLLPSHDRTTHTTVKGIVFSAKNRSAPVIRVCAGCMLALLLLLGGLTPWCSFRDTDTRASSFADEIARNIITQMGSRTWLVSNGQLDSHLLVQSVLLKHPLTLVPMRQRIPPGELRKLDAAIASDPVFEGQNRLRLQNALSIGSARFIMEWFKTDPTAAAHAAVFASPDIWTACGFRAVPEGMVFGGIPRDAVLDVAKIKEQERRFSDVTAPLLVPREREKGTLAALRGFLRVRTSFAANELGVLLEEANLAEDAYQAYRRAGRIAPLNISAAVNAYVLATSRKIHPEEVDRLRKNIKECASSSLIKNMPFAGIQQTYGTIRQTDFYRQQIAVWSAAGVSLAAANKIEKTSALSNNMNALSLANNAVFYLQAGMSVKAEACCREALAKDAANVEALCAMATLSLNSGKLDEAVAWLDKARRTGAKEEVLLYQTITLALLRKEDAQAQRMLEKATKEYPTDVRYWYLLSEVLLRQNATQEVEFNVLPAIQKALNSPNHYLPHVVRGYLMQKKGPSNFRAARLELLQAVSMNALLTDVWSVIFELDMALGNTEFIEADAQSQLSVDPDHALANYLLGAINLTRGALKRSEDFLRRSIEKRPTSPACNDLAENLRQQKRLAEAEPFARQALAIQSDSSPALDTLACILLETQRIDEAAQYSEQANRLCPKTPAFQLTLLRARVQQRKTDETTRLLDEMKATKTPIPEDLQKEIRLLQRESAGILKPKG
jgi:tetratricopeptide (TPR) repeat protein